MLETHSIFNAFNAAAGGFKIPIPAAFGSSYQGLITLAVGQPIISMVARLFYQAKPRKTIEVSLTCDKVSGHAQILEWSSV